MSAHVDPPGFDCFLSYNSKDKPAVRALAAALHARGVSVWLDEQRLRPGLPWQNLLEEGIRASRSVAVLVGADGLGPWQDEEMRAALSLAVKDKRPVIPVVLANAPARPELPHFLQARTWVDMRIEAAPDGTSALDLLVWGITDVRPNGDPERPATRPGRPERQVLHECIESAFASEDELRTFCFEHFPAVYRNLREMDRRSHITRELIGYVMSRAEAGVLWQLLQARNAACADKYREVAG
jgi:hypothetical protein